MARESPDVVGDDTVVVGEVDLDVSYPPADRGVPRDGLEAPERRRREVDADVAHEEGRAGAAEPTARQASGRNLWVGRVVCILIMGDIMVEKNARIHMGLVMVLLVLVIVGIAPTGYQLENFDEELVGEAEDKDLAIWCRGVGHIGLGRVFPGVRVGSDL